jgi:hypothetical protein
MGGEAKSGHDVCAECKHERIEHGGTELSDECNFIKWVGGKPEWRCMCNKFVERG